MKDNSRKIMDALIDKTTKNEVKWDKTSNPDEYKLQFKNGSALTISKTSAKSTAMEILGGITYNFRLFNSDGQVLDTLNFLANEKDKKIVENLYALVTRAQSNEFGTYNDIFKELGL